MMRNSQTSDIGAWVLTAVIMVIGLHAVLWMGLYASTLPNAYGEEAAQVYLRTRTFFLKEYDLPIFRSFIVLITALTIVTSVWLGKKLTQSSVRTGMTVFLWPSVMWLMLGYTAAFFMVILSSPPWAKVLLYTAVGGNLVTWLLWPWRQEWQPRMAGIVQRSIQRIAAVHKALSAERNQRLGARVGFAVFCGAVLCTLLFNKSFWPQEPAQSLPYFWPLKFRAEAVYALSFIVPCIYMAGVLTSVKDVLRPKASIGPAVLGALSLYSLWLFTSYVNMPTPEHLWTVALPAVPITALMWSRRSNADSGLLWVSVLTGIQAALMGVWIHEQLRFPVSPAHFSKIIYGFFIGGSVLMYVGLTVFNARNLFSFAALQAVVAAVMTLALFKLIYYDYRGELARGWFHAMGIVTMAQPVIWFIGHAAYGRLIRLVVMVPSGVRFWMVQLAAALFTFGAAFVPDIEALTAHIFMGEYMHHTDTFVMGPLWAYVKGAVIDVDVYSRYGIGTVPFFAYLMKMMGGISYTHLFAAVVWVTALYFVAVYVLYRRWFGGTLLALTAWMMGFKADIAFDLAYPFVFTYPQSTMARLWPDILWMGCLLMFVDTLQKRWLAAAAVCMGFTCWYMPSIGLYMAPGMLAIAVIAAWRHFPGKFFVLHCVWPFVVVGATGGALFYLLCGSWIFDPIFWSNATDFFSLFIICNSSPIVQSLLNKQYLDVLVFAVIVLTYAFTIIKVGLDFLRGEKAPPRDWLALAVSLYGLGLLEHYVVFSNGNNYYSKVVPFFAVLFHWITRALSMLPEITRKRVVMGGAMAAFIALVSSHSYMSYPNLWNISKDPLLDKRVARPLPDGRPYFFHKDRFTTLPELELPLNNYGDTNERLYTEFDFANHKAMVNRYYADSNYAQDAALIRGLTAPDDAVPLISSYEVRILMQANRRPFFYYFPLLATRAMGVRSLPSDMLDRTSDTDIIMNALMREQPPYVFIEKVMNGPIPPAYDQVVPGLAKVLRYVREHYEPHKEGYYLIAMKRKN